MASSMTDEKKEIDEELITILQEILAGLKQSTTATEDKGVTPLPAPLSIEDLAASIAKATCLNRGHTKNGIEEKTPDPGRTQITAEEIARNGGQTIAQDKRARARNWELNEKILLLVLKLGILHSNFLCSQGRSNFKYPKLWAYYVSDPLGRAVKSCQEQWDSLVKPRNAIRDYESKIRPGTVGHVSFWQMDEHQKQKHIVNLPKVFPRVLYELMERIDAVKKDRSIRLVDNLPSSSTAGDEVRALPVEHSLLSASSSQITKSLVDNLPSSSTAGDEVRALPVEHSLLSTLSSQITKQVELILEEKVIPRLRRLEENEQSYQEKRLKLDEETVALKRKEIYLLERLWARTEQELGRPNTGQLGEAPADIPNENNFDWLDSLVNYPDLPS